MRMQRRYLIAAAPAIIAIAIGWIMPLVIYGHFADSFDGGGRVLDENGNCCMEPTAYFVARTAALLSPLVAAASIVAMLVIKVLSKKR